MGTEAFHWACAGDGNVEGNATSKTGWLHRLNLYAPEAVAESRITAAQSGANLPEIQELIEFCLPGKGGWLSYGTMKEACKGQPYHAKYLQLGA